MWRKKIKNEKRKWERKLGKKESRVKKRKIGSRKVHCQML